MSSETPHKLDYSHDYFLTSIQSQFVWRDYVFSFKEAALHGAMPCWPLFDSSLIWHFCLRAFVCGFGNDFYDDWFSSWNEHRLCSEKYCSTQPFNKSCGKKTLETQQQNQEDSCRTALGSNLGADNFFANQSSLKSHSEKKHLLFHLNLARFVNLIICNKWEMYLKQWAKIPVGPKKITITS